MGMTIRMLGRWWEYLLTDEQVRVLNAALDYANENPYVESDYGKAAHLIMKLTDMLDAEQEART